MRLTTCVSASGSCLVAINFPPHFLYFIWYNIGKLNDGSFVLISYKFIGCRLEAISGFVAAAFSLEKLEAG